MRKQTQPNYDNDVWSNLFVMIGFKLKLFSIFLYISHKTYLPIFIFINWLIECHRVPGERLYSQANTAQLHYWYMIKIICDDLFT